ncbi:hypothetical protein NTGBS_1030016 [Candidatus Nitrotoga sp. BS]|nr:hypothetical protein NTGBS_1030016 [Candidatus Nitrotoga sp. BS]
MELPAIRLSAIKHALNRWLWALLLARIYEVLLLLCPQCDDSWATKQADIAAASAAGTRTAAVGDAGCFASGYSACRDHTEKEALFNLLNAPHNAGITLIESFAMLPTAAVSGFYFPHTQSQYFASAKVDKDQVEDYARRKGWALEETERWLTSVLSY